MSQHKPDFIYTDRSGSREHRVRCHECGETSGWQESKQPCEDWWRAHVDKIERIKSHLGGHTPSLESQLRYYQNKADDPSISPEHREQWQQLADSLNRRLHPKPTSEDQFLPGL